MKKPPFKPSIKTSLLERAFNKTQEKAKVKSHDPTRLEREYKQQLEELIPAMYRLQDYCSKLKSFVDYVKGNHGDFYAHTRDILKYTDATLRGEA